ncbi:MAG: nucleotide exchange factor GrpE [Eubacterium sp.]|nr:nucleotide exchange factor GrpE [Eubacterium sp.]
MEENKKEIDESILEEAAEDIKEEAAPAEETESEAPEEATTEEEVKDSGEEEAPKGKKKKKSARVLEMELEKSEAKAAELTDKYQRLMAEFENARKRNAKEQSHMYDVGAKEVLGKLLPVVDNFERGLDALSDEEKEGAFAQGIIKIYQQLITVFDEIGVKAMDAAGKEFNPDFHNAVMHVEDENMGENLVAEEFQKGYMYKDTVLRHSMVKVVN